MKEDHENHAKAVPENATAPPQAEKEPDELPCPEGFDPVFWAVWGRPNQEHYIRTIKNTTENGGQK